MLSLIGMGLFFSFRKLNFFWNKVWNFFSNGDIENIACSVWHVQPKKDKTQCSEQHYSCGEKVFHYVELPRRQILKEGKNLGMDYNEYKKRFKNGFIFKAIDFEGKVQAFRSIWTSFVLGFKKISVIQSRQTCICSLCEFISRH